MSVCSVFLTVLSSFELAGAIFAHIVGGWYWVWCIKISFIGLLESWISVFAHLWAVSLALDGVFASSLSLMICTVLWHSIFFVDEFGLPDLGLVDNLLLRLFEGLLCEGRAIHGNCTLLELVISFLERCRVCISWSLLQWSKENDLVALRALLQTVG